MSKLNQLSGETLNLTKENIETTYHGVTSLTHTSSDSKEVI